MELETEEKIQAELAHDERLLWSGMPRQGLCLRAIDAVLIPFSLVWGAGAVTWELKVVSGHAPFFFGLFGIPFVMFAFYIVVGRFCVDSYQRSRTWYGVTDRRVIMITSWVNRSVKSLASRGLDDISLSERKDGSGTITFGRSPGMASGWYGAWWPGMSSRLPPSFDLIPEARKVYDLVRETRQQDSARRGVRSSPPTGLPNLDSRPV